MKIIKKNHYMPFSIDQPEETRVILKKVVYLLYFGININKITYLSDLNALHLWQAINSSLLSLYVFISRSIPHL